ncbi:putative ABC transporter [Leptomonas pyrrhocoris]|uniref:Putative ABC transporter n=1 Tax=Leptomonas pyrrhocoris TaxID=157538 RepID=A0A0M9FPV8_LEPPY|nr:putative ABC transporter [Leptomonas pyrrhocoris]KPA73489.1 putative ABC transporter [Leptomonas pyrrhocoris]|eukprot:XP_015651928.1 putative ABC transporter [Leptomonas pyrrhocoris]
MPYIRSRQRTMSSVSVALSSVPLMERFGVLGTSAAFLLSFLAQRYYLRIFGKSIRQVHTEDDTRVTWSLFGNFFQIARIALPTWRCREFAGTTIFILLFVVKAVLRVWVSKANGEVLATMLHGAISQRLYRFVHKILIRTAVGLASAMTSGVIEGLRPWLIGCYRERLCHTFQRRFYKHLVYYQATVLDNRLEAADTVIATYCGEFAEHFAELPYYFVLPGLECATSMTALVQQAGLRPALIMSGITTVAVLVLRALSPAFGRIHSRLLSLEDDYRRMLTNDMNDVENIAMHNAGLYTRRRLDVSLAKLKYTLDHMALAKGNFEMLETTFSTFMTVMAHIVTFGSSRKTYFHRSVNDVYLEIQLIEDLNSSVKDFVVNFRELSHLTEFATKMAAFDTTLQSIAAGTFIREAPTIGDEPRPNTPIEYTPVERITHVKGAEVFPLVKMENVVLESPTGQPLFEGMSVNFMSDEDWVLIGENGCGKTSLLRMLCGLWMPKTGLLAQDDSVRFLLAPQHSYMAPQCTLYEQLAFPKPVKVPTQRIRKAVVEAIELAGAQTVVNVIRGYESPVMGLDLDDVDESYDWSSLSGGQKERISMARVFFHILCMDRSRETPVAILDEATSMMDDTEQDVLNHLRRLKVRMISVTHRDVVIRHHTNILKISHGGKWSVEKVTNTVKIGERVETDDKTV